MSRGSYIGGSTIIRPGSDWFGGNDDRVIKPKKSSKRKKRALTLAELKLNYLNNVLTAELKKKPLPPIPKKSQKVLKPLVDAAGGAKKWAESQPQYKVLKDTKRKKIIKRGLILDTTCSSQNDQALSNNYKSREEAIKALQKKIDDELLIIDKANKSIVKYRKLIIELKK